MANTPRRQLPIAAVVAIIALTMAALGCGSGTTSPSSAGAGAGATNNDPDANDTYVDRAVGLRADDIAVVTTPPGGWSGSMPAMVLSECTEELAATAPDMRGMWTVVQVDVDGAVVTDHPMKGHLQRIEQCGDRVVITAGGIIHDMRSDGTLAGAVRDVAAADFATPITVVSRFANGAHVLEPVGAGNLRITRHIDGDQLVWDYVGFIARLDRLGPPQMDVPSIDTGASGNATATGIASSPTPSPRS